MSFIVTELFEENPFWPMRRNLNTGQLTWFKTLDLVEEDIRNDEMDKVRTGFIDTGHKNKELISQINSTDLPPRSRAVGGKKKEPKKLFNINQKYRSKYF